MPSASRASSATASVDGLQEVLLEQQVLGRVAGQRQLGEEHELGAGVARRGDLLGDLGGVALEVADAAVDLREGEAERGDQAHGPHSPRPRPSQASANSLQARIERVVGLVDAPPGERRGRPGAGPAGEDDRLAGGGQLGVERPGHLLLDALQLGSGIGRVVEDHDVAELERVQDLVVAQAAPVARDQLLAVRAAGRPLVGHPRGRVVAGPEVGLQLARALGDTGDLGVVARVEGQREPDQARDGHQHAGRDDRQPPQARLLVRRAAGRARPLRRAPFGGTPAAADSSSIAVRRSSAKSSRSAIAS